MNNKSKLQDYKTIRCIGKGSFGQILLVQRGNDQLAMKKISKKQIIKVNKMHEPFVQRQILFKFKQLAPNYFVNLYETHSDTDYIYMIMQLCDGGSLENVIKHINQIQNKYEVIKKIIIRMVIILQTMHKYGVIHRDLKPSNFLFNKNGIMKLADFGTAFAKQEFFTQQVAKLLKQYRQMSKKRQSTKIDQDDRDSIYQTRRATFVGTPLYMAPELLEQDFCGPQSDIWALGCIIYQLINSKPPFYDQSQGMVWKKILNQDFTDTVLPKNCQMKQYQHYKNLIRALLVKQRLKRLGYGIKGYEDIKSHPFFQGTNWELQKNKPIKQLAAYFQKNKSAIDKQTVGSTGQQKIIFSGAVLKKMFFGNFKERMLVLNSTPKLVYYDMQTGQQKGQIILAKDTPVSNQGSKIFTVTTQKKTYYFKSIKAHQWMEMIKEAIVAAFY